MPAGTLYIIGGGLDASRTKVFSSFIAAAGGSDAVIAFVLSASGAGPDETFAHYRDIFVSLGVKKENCLLVPLYGRGVTDERGENAVTGDAPGLAERFSRATGVYFTGGDQYYTSKCFLRADGTDTRLLSTLRSIYENGGVIGGSSAGAAIMSRVMIGEGSSRGLLAYGVKHGYEGYDPDAEDESPDSGSPLLLTNEGLGFLKNAVVDQHFNTRPRLLRLIEAVLTNDSGARTGFGVSEDTALIYRAGEHRVLGGAGVYALDCRDAERISAGNYRSVRLSLLYEGDVMNGDGGITVAREAPEGERYFQRDYISGAFPDSPTFDDALDKLLRGDDTSVFTDAEHPYIKCAAVYGAADRAFVVTLRLARTAETFGAYSEVAGHGHTSAAFVRLDTETRELI